MAVGPSGPLPASVAFPRCDSPVRFPGAIPRSPPASRKMLNMPRFCLLISAIFLLGYLGYPGSGAAAESRPNILWLVVEDMSCHFGYQGEKLVKTPHVDRLAAEGIAFNNAYATAPVCSASRSAMITGMYQTTIGAHHHRSSRGKLKIELPTGIRTVPELFRAAGYYTCNADENISRPGKEDYNFDFDRAALYDGVDWSSRAPGQPFFAQVQFRGGKLRDVRQWRQEVDAGLEDLVSADQVMLPPYYPDNAILRTDWAAYLNAVQYTDQEIGRVIARLRSEAILDNTVIFFLTDHGISHARGKQFLYDEGSKVPFVVWAPGRIDGGQTRSDLIPHIDIAATSLALATIPIPKSMQSRSLLDREGESHDHVVLARDRCDETTDRIRAIRRGDFKYIRNYFPLRPYLQPCAYKDSKPFMPVMREWHAAGKLNPTQSLHFAATRPQEELYDLTRDPFEIHNLASDPSHRERLTQFRTLLDRWEIDSDDRGRFPESEAMYDSDMAAYLSPRMRENDPAYASDVEANIRLMKQWQLEGK